MSESDEYKGKSAYHGSVARDYERDRTAEPIWAVEQEFVARWVSGIPHGSVLLDLPTGTGRFLPMFIARGLQVHARDISRDMLNVIREKIPDYRAQGLTIEEGDAQKINLENDSVDYVVSWRFFHLIPRSVIPGVLAEFKRVCRRDIIIQVFSVRTSVADASVFTVGLRKLKGLIRPFLPWNWGKHMRTPWSHIDSYTHRESDLLAMFNQCGLQLKSIHVLEPEAENPSKVYVLCRRVSNSPCESQL